MIRSATTADAAAICEIYNHYILNTIVNFEEEALDANAMSMRIEEVQQRFPWLVYISASGKVLGYAYSTAWRSRCGYRKSVETSVYLDKNAQGQGIGTALYAALLEKLAELKVHAIIGGIALPNETSVRLHEKFGFEKVAHFKEVGFKFNQWIDVGYWEKILKHE
jgi:phosphinothricin acetyltransferase